MNNARTTSFLEFLFTAQYTSAAFVVPSGYTALVKHVSVMNLSAGECEFVVVGVSPDATVTHRFVDAHIPAYTTFDWNGGVAVVPGGQIQGVNLSGTGSCFVSGALMPSPPYFPPVQTTRVVSVGLDGSINVLPG